MRRLLRNIAIILFLSLTLQIDLQAQSLFGHKEHRTSDKAVTADDVLFYINKYRSRKGLPPLRMNGTASAAAEKHSRDMAANRVAFGHSGFDARMHRLMKELKPVYSTAENVAYGNISAKEVVDMWVHSPGHKRNIEGNYNVTGIGIASDRHGTLYFTQIFLNRK